MELQDQADDAKEFVDSVKENYLAEEIYVFTPDGAVRSLPKDSGPIDFAYEIHTKVGEKATGAKVNGRMVPLTTKLQDRGSGWNCHQSELLWTKSWLAQYGQDQQGA